MTTNKSYVLIAEDDEPKLLRLKDFLGTEFPDCQIEARRSATTALAALREKLPDLLLLDMSLPTYEIGPGEQGGRPQDFGGLAVMDFMAFEELNAPVVIVTQYETFPIAKGEDMTLEDVAAKAKDDHPGIFKGLVYYNSVMSTWQEKLAELVRGIILEGQG
jgi:CheY-like chemotaxis protein